MKCLGLLKGSKSSVLSRITFEEDKRVENGGTFTILNEDHTAGNLLRMQLLRDKKVLFAGYKQPHPLENKIELRVQTNKESNPLTVTSFAMEAIAIEMDRLSSEFKVYK
jgi:DNA-directed RNA polymerase II subunit RPB11